MKTRTRTAALLVALAALLTAAACGGSDDGSESQATAVEPAAAADEESERPGEAAPEPVVEEAEPAESTTGADGDHMEEPEAEDGEVEPEDAEGAETEHGETSGEHAHAEAVEAPDGLAVSLEAVADSKSGYNLHLTTENFTFTPESVGGDHTPGEGHAHVYVDGEKLGRIYGDWFHLDDLEPGPHDIRVTLNANTHSDYAINNETVAASVTLGEEPSGESEQVADTPTEPAEPAIQEIVIEAGEPVGGVSRIEAKKGDTVLFAVRSDIPEEVHVHGFDVTKSVTPGKPTRFKFEAGFEGIFEVEAHDAGHVVIAKVVVKP